jgi:hypothetical protein
MTSAIRIAGNERMAISQNCEPHSIATWRAEELVVPIAQTTSDQPEDSEYFTPNKALGSCDFRDSSLYCGPMRELV